VARAREVADWLHELADRVAFAGDNPFKVRAYREAARRVALGLLDVNDAGALEAAPGIGPKIAAKIAAMARGEIPPSLVRLRREGPPELSALLRLPGVGPSTARRLWTAGIGTLAGLQQAVAVGRDLPGVSPPQRRQLERAFAERAQGVPLLELLALTQDLREAIPGLSPAGGLRRLDPVVPSPRWVAPARDASRRAWQEMQPLRLSAGWTVSPDALVFVPEESLGALLLWHTGPEPFLREVGEALSAQGLHLTQRGLLAGDAAVPCPDEAEIFRCAGLRFVPPTLRGLPPSVRAAVPVAVQGDLHTHSTWSDGLEDMASMARAALARGYHYLAITDHSQGLKVAHGLTPERFRAQRQEIDEVRGRLPEGFALLQGCEVDIEADGSLDLPDDLLKELDVVIASVHHHFDQSVEVSTRRLVRAIRHPLVTAIGHPGARKLGERPPIAADWTAVFAAARDTGTALELNGSPLRLDLDPQWLAGEVQGLAFVIDTDAHSSRELDYMQLGLAQAQKAGIRTEQVLNAGPLDALRQRAHRP